MFSFLAQQLEVFVVIVNLALTVLFHDFLYLFALENGLLEQPESLVKNYNMWKTTPKENMSHLELYVLTSLVDFIFKTSGAT